MRSIDVGTGPDGLSWTVRVDWMPRWRHYARRFGGWRRRSADAEARVVADRDLVWVLPSADASGASERNGVPRTSSSDGLADAGADGKQRDKRGGGGGLFAGIDSEVAAILLIFIGIVLAVALAWWVLIPLALLVLDLAAVVVLLVVGTATRVLLRRPWTVEAVSSAGHRVTRPVVGWRNALRARDEMAEALRSGTLRPPPAADAGPAGGAGPVVSSG